MAQSSPITHIDANSVPIIAFHRTKDDVVPILHAKILHEALEKDDIPQKLVILEGEGHG